MTVRNILTGSATLALLAGCAGGGSGVTTPTAGGGVTQQSVTRSMHILRNASHVTLRPGIAIHPRAAGAPKPFINSEALAKTANTIAVSDVTYNLVDIFDASGNLDATLSDGFIDPQGMSSDIDGDLFIADTGNSRIVKYAAGFQGTPTTVSDPHQFSADVDSFGNGKWLAVTNIETTSGGPGSVSIYKDDKNIATVSSPNLTLAYFCAFDAGGNLFVSGIDANGFASIGEIANATSGGKLAYTQLKTGNTLEFPGAIQVTTNGSIVYDDQDGNPLGGTLFTYDPPKNGSLGKPTATTHMQGTVDMVTFAFTKDMSSLYGADAGSITEVEYAYPAGGEPSMGFYLPGDGDPVGTAVVPTQWPKVHK